MDRSVEILNYMESHLSSFIHLKAIVVEFHAAFKKEISRIQKIQNLEELELV